MPGLALALPFLRWVSGLGGGGIPANALTADDGTVLTADDGTILTTD